jgi:hypothetical protein
MKITIERDNGTKVVIEGPDAAEQALTFLAGDQKAAAFLKRCKDAKELLDQMKRDGYRPSHWPPTPSPHRDGLIS